MEALPPVLMATMVDSRRREMLCMNVPECPACGHEQVQLMVWTTTPAQWRCRICKFKFEDPLEGKFKREDGDQNDRYPNPSRD